MTADIRTAAQRESDARYPEIVLAPENEQRADDFVEGFLAGAARVTPTREQLVVVAERVIGDFPDIELDPKKSWAQQEAEEVADAVLALMQELAGGERP